MKPQEKKLLMDRQKQFLDTVKTKQAEIMSKFKGPASKDAMRQKVLLLVKQSLDSMGIIPGQPGAEEKALAFIEKLPPEITQILVGEGEENQLSNTLSQRQPVAEPVVPPAPSSEPLNGPDILGGPPSTEPLPAATDITQ